MANANARAPETEKLGNTTHKAIVTCLALFTLNANTVSLLPDGAILVIISLNLVISIEAKAEQKYGCEENNDKHNFFVL